LVKVIIREIRAEDREKVCKVLTSSFKGKELYWALRDLEYTYVVVAEAEGEIIGVMELYEVLGENIGKIGVIDYLAVSPPFRRKGIGSRLVKYAEKLFKIWSNDFSAASTKSSNIASMRLFRKLGYEEIREGDKRYHVLKWALYAYEDDVIFLKEIKRI